VPRDLGTVDVQLDDSDLKRIDALGPPRGVAVRYQDEAASADFRPHHPRSIAR